MNKIIYQINEDIQAENLEDKAVRYHLFESTSAFQAASNPRFTFIDLFAGIGGFRISMQNLGGECVFSSEWDEKAKQTYAANFGEVPFGDITLEETKSFIPKEFDILCAGFPCQAFSIAGRRGGFEDTRGTLFFDVAEIIRRHQPKAFFLENVKGLMNHDKGRTLKTILNTLREDLGYFVPEPEILNAKNFGVPQNRERIFIVGFRKDLGIEHFEYPKPTGIQTAFIDIREKDTVPTKYYLSTRYIDTLRKHKQRHEEKGNGFGYEIIPDNGIANAIVVGGMGRERNLVIDHRITDFMPTTNIKGEVNREGIRKMTPREWARLQGFPESFKIVVADASAYRQFGNSVAVPAIQATAEKILDTLKEEKVMAHVFSGNKGEWSEPYVLLKLLADGELYLGDGELNKIESMVLPIINILREEQDGIRRYTVEDKQRIVFDFGNPEALQVISITEFKKNAELLLKEINGKGGKTSGATFCIPEIEVFLRRIGCTRLSAKSLSKSDVHIVVHDVRTGVCPTLGFSIKSELGSKATLLNASGATNFTYEIQNCNSRLSEQINSLRTSKGRKDIRARMTALTQEGCSLTFQELDNLKFSNNLILIDSKLPEILAEMLCQYYSGNADTIVDLSAKVCRKNPNGYDYSNNHHFYEYKIKRLLCETALGMRPAETWHGKYDATGGYLVVRKDGEIVCYHLYSRNQFEDYLFLNTKFETSSSSRHHFGDVYEQNGRFFFKLNLQIRFR